MFLANLTDEQRHTCYCLAFSVVVSDGELASGEEALMMEMRREMALPDEFEPHYVPAEGQQTVFRTRKSRVVVLIALIRMAYADGAFEIEEECFIRDLAQVFDVSDGDFVKLDNWVKRLIALQIEAHDYM